MKKKFIIIGFFCIIFNIQAANSADIILEKAITVSGPYAAGQSISYNISVINGGPEIATNILLTDTPTNMTITSVSSISCSSIPCTIPSLTNGAVEHVTITATIDSNGTFDNVASAVAEQVDSNPANNTDNTDNGGITIGVASTPENVPALNLSSLLLLISLLGLFLYRKKTN